MKKYNRAHEGSAMYLEKLDNGWTYRDLANKYNMTYRQAFHTKILHKRHLKREALKSYKDIMARFNRAKKFLGKDFEVKKICRNARELQIFQLRYGEMWRMEAIGEKLGVTRQRIDQILKQIDKRIGV